MDALRDGFRAFREIILVLEMQDFNGNFRAVLLSVQALLSSPNPDDPLNNEAASHWKTNEASAIKKAVEFT